MRGFTRRVSKEPFLRERLRRLLGTTAVLTLASLIVLAVYYPTAAYKWWLVGFGGLLILVFVIRIGSFVIRTGSFRGGVEYTYHAWLVGSGLVVIAAVLALVVLGGLAVFYLAAAYGWWLVGFWGALVLIPCSIFIAMVVLVRKRRSQDDPSDRYSDYRRHGREVLPQLFEVPHKTTSMIAITSGSIALVVAVVGLTMTLNGTALWPILTYAVTGLFGVASLAMGALVSLQRSVALTSFRLTRLYMKKAYNQYVLGSYQAQSRCHVEFRERIIAQRDALVRSGDLADVDRATECINSLPGLPASESES